MVPMALIRPMNIADLDLNLLRTFDAIYAESSVSRAALRLDVSQPTVSHALARLRALVRDPLFVRRANGVAPTAKADRLAGAVRQALGILDAAIHEADRYDPRASERTFRLHMTDIGEAVFLPRLMAALAERAPRVRIDVHQLDSGDIVAALESGRIDLALGDMPALSSVERVKLLSERYVVAMRRGHPMARARPSRAALARLDYALVRSHPAIARALDAAGLTARVRLSIPHFMVLPRILAETDLAVVMPLRLYETFARMGDYAVWRSRVRLPAFDVGVHWAPRFSGDAGNRWLRETVVALFREK
jgi:DNA-binding transcriptional LysR family regulator